MPANPDRSASPPPADPGAATLKCPTCGKSVPDDPDRLARLGPFCAARCRWVDLGRWFDEAYVVEDPFDSDTVDDPPPPA